MARIWAAHLDFSTCKSQGVMFGDFSEKNTWNKQSEGGNYIPPVPLEMTPPKVKVPLTVTLTSLWQICLYLLLVNSNRMVQTASMCLQCFNLEDCGTFPHQPSSSAEQTKKSVLPIMISNHAKHLIKMYCIVPVIGTVALHFYGAIEERNCETVFYFIYKWKPIPVIDQILVIQGDFHINVGKRLAGLRGHYLNVLCKTII